MVKKINSSPDTEDIRNVELHSVLAERYLAYALSTVMHRALPDVRDGLKPVHRRIIHAMNLLKVYPHQSYIKCARIVGDVMGKFHPHGDASIYDALVRMAQDFSMRYPLVDGQGNFGNIDGDNAAAMRYTEARMSEAMPLLLEGINENAVDFRFTYNEQEKEPVVLPSAFPNLLANGSSGIAVGMATNIPPHNVFELCAAALHLIDNSEATTADLLNFVQGPDFPTGGVLVSSAEEFLQAYETGRGSLRLRACWHKEAGSHGSYIIVVTQIPYQVQKSRLIEKIAELLLARRLPLLENLYDESAADIRIVLEPKSRTVNPEVLMESLFKLTDLEIRFSLNMNVLSAGKIPNVLSLKKVLQQWLAHRRDVLIRRTEFRLDAISHRLEIVSGYLIAYLNLDEVIAIIREEDEPKPILMAKFGLTDTQAEAILNMRLRSLRRLEEFELKKEFDGLKKEQEQLQDLLKEDRKQWGVIKKQIQQVQEQYSLSTEIGKRRTSFAALPQHDLQQIEHAFIEKEPITFILSQKGWLRALKGHMSDSSSFTFKEGDSLACSFFTYTTEKILVATTGGKFYTLAASALPRGRGAGEPIRLLLEIEQDQDILTAFPYQAEQKLALVSHQGFGFILNSNELIAATRKGKQIMNAKAPDYLQFCQAVSGDMVAIIGENRKLLIFPAQEIPEISRGKGVRLQKYKDGGVKDITFFCSEQGFSWTDTAQRSFKKMMPELLPWQGHRAMPGRLAPNGFPRSGLFFNAKD